MFTFLVRARACSSSLQSDIKIKLEEDIWRWSFTNRFQTLKSRITFFLLTETVRKGTQTGENVSSFNFVGRGKPKPNSDYDILIVSRNVFGSPKLIQDMGFGSWQWRNGNFTTTYGITVTDILITSANAPNTTKYDVRPFMLNYLVRFWQTCSDSAVYHYKLTNLGQPLGGEFQDSSLLLF